MKNSAMEKILYGLKGSYGILRENEEYNKLLVQFNELHKSLWQALSKEEKEILDKLDFLSAELENEAALTHFAEGFKLGLAVGK